MTAHILIGCLIVAECAHHTVSATVRAALHGSVNTVARAPLESARVELYALSAETLHWGERRSATVTDGSGRFAFTRCDCLPSAPGERRLVMLKVTAPGFAAEYRRASVSTGEQIALPMIMHEPGRLVLNIRQRDGRAVGGARVRALTLRGPNGEIMLRRDDFDALAVSASGSGVAGDLQIAGLPFGAFVDVVVEHEDYAPVEMRNVAIGAESRADVLMSKGARLSFHAAPSEGAGRIADALVLLRPKDADSPAMLFDSIRIPSGEAAHLTVREGSYSIVQMRHPRCFLTPTYPRKGESFIVSQEAQDVFFNVRTKIGVRGRVIDRGTGLPVANVTVDGEIATRLPLQSSQCYDGEWTYVDDAESDADGEYVITLAPGPARLSIHHWGYIAEPGAVEVNVATNGRSRAPDLFVRRLPKVSGVVCGADGKPAQHALVRFRGDLRWMRPTVTDSEGRFSIQLMRLPPRRGNVAEPTIEPLVAFDLLHSLSAKAQVRLDADAELSVPPLRLEPEECARQLIDFRATMTDADLGRRARPDSAEPSTFSLIGRHPPDLSGALWINTARTSMSLKDFHGKHVLLMFWATWCGTCHADFPLLKVLHDAYGGARFAIIAVHDGSETARAVRSHVEKDGLPFAVVVDTADGSILKRYRTYGVTGYPAYMLIGPDGKVLLQDGVSNAPRLSRYMAEIIRCYMRCGGLLWPEE